MSSTTIHEIAAYLGADRPAQDGVIARISGIAGATLDAVVFAADDESQRQALASKAGLILARVKADDPRVIVVRNPRTAFAQVYGKWFEPVGAGQIHPTAVIDPTAQIGTGCEIGAGSVVEAHVRLGAGCVLGPRVTVHAGTTLGDRVRVQSGAVLGSAGFGYVSDETGHRRFPQIGTLVISDDVEIGANTTIDRGALGETRIGRGTKIDNLVHIAHNCVIGERVLIAAQVGLAGSITIEDDAMLGGQAGLGERVTIGRGVILGGQGGVLPGKTLTGPGVVFWGTPAQPSARISSRPGTNEERLMAIVVIGGHTRNIGKTSVMAGLIAAMPEKLWTAFKITQFGHGVCSANGEPCDCDTGSHTMAISEERNQESGTDSSRYLAAGAVRSYWVRTRQGQLAEAMPRVRKLLAANGNCIVESNSILRFPEAGSFRQCARSGDGRLQGIGKAISRPC